MSVATRPRDPFRAPLADAMRAQARRALEAGPPEPQVGAPVLRLACVLAAGAYALHRWLALIEDPDRGTALRGVLVAALAGAAAMVIGLRVRSRRRRAAWTAALLLVALWLMLAV